MHTIVNVLALLHMRARSERGASLVEYALLVSFIALACFAAIQILGDQVQEPYSQVGASLS